MKVCLPFLALLLPCSLGCGGKGEAPNRSASQSKATDKADPPGEKAKLAGGPAEADKGLPRKIKYTAEMKLIVADLAAAATQLRADVKTHKALVASSEENASPGAIRAAQWRIRVPVEHFEPFRDAVRKLGDIEKNVTDSEDLTAEYYDLKEHIKNKLAEEVALRQLLEKAAAKSDNLDGYLKVSEKLEAVRDYINRQEARLKVLENITDLTTVTVHLREKEKYDPERPPSSREDASFARRVGRTFEDSISGLVAVGHGLLFFVVAAAPWLGVLAVVGGPFFLMWRKRKARAEKEALEVVIVPEKGEAKEPPTKRPDTE